MGIGKQAIIVLCLILSLIPLVASAENGTLDNYYVNAENPPTTTQVLNNINTSTSNMDTLIVLLFITGLVIIFIIVFLVLYFNLRPRKSAKERDINESGYCSKCDSAMAENALFCGRCGNKRG